MRIITILILLFCSSPVFAQTDTSYHLLWYEGRKIKPNVLLRPNGDTVRYDPVKRTVKVTSSKGDGKKFDNMLTELGKTKQRMAEMMKQLSYLPKPMWPQLSLLVTSAFEEADEECRKLLTNVITLPDIPMPGSKPVGGKGGGYMTGTIEEDWQKLIDEFRDFREKHEKDRLAVLPEPPRFDYTYCASCDSSKQTAYNKAVNNFIEELITKEEASLMEKAQAASRYLYDMYPGRLRDDLEYAVKSIINFLNKRAQTKVTRMVERYCNDPERALAVMDAAVSIERRLQVMGFAGSFPGYSGRAFEAYQKRIQRALDEYDYPIALNHKLVLLYERKMQVYAYHMGALRDKVMKFNRFKLNMNIMAKASGDGGYLSAELEGDNWFWTYVDNDNCRLQWVRDGIKQHKADMSLVAAALVGGGGSATYAGSKNWSGNAPLIRIDFCDDEQEDSVTAFPFFEENFAESWIFPVVGRQHVILVNNVLMGCFLDVERTKNEAAEFKANPKKIEQMKQEMLAQYRRIGNISKASFSNPNQVIDMSQLSQMANAGVAGQNIQEIVQKANPGRYIFTPAVHNREKLIVQDKLDGKILFPQNAVTEYALFYIKLENDPRK